MTALELLQLKIRLRREDATMARAMAAGLRARADKLQPPQMATTHAEASLYRRLAAIEEERASALDGVVAKLEGLVRGEEAP